MGRRAPHYSIVLAAGEGTRMGSATRPKFVFQSTDSLPSTARSQSTMSAESKKIFWSSVP